MQVIVMTSDVSLRVLPGFAFLFNRFWDMHQPVTICGYSPPMEKLPENFNFYSIGKFANYPVHAWSNSLRHVLDNVAEEVFVLLLDDYWFVRHVDRAGVRVAYDYMGQFRNVLKFDLCRDRLWNDPGRYAYEANTYGHAGHLDLIKSLPGSPYHMSLWGGMWRRDILRNLLVPGETAQEIELNGTGRLSAHGDNILILGTRQAPILHGNILMSKNQGRPAFADTGWAIHPLILEEMRRKDLLQGLE